ncbi:MAG: DNA polymerase III subunit delta [Chloroflexia bacterium]
MLIALVGPDRYSVAQALRGYLAKYSPESDGFGDFNLTRFDGGRVTPDELARATQSVGFLGERRVIVVEGLMSRFSGGKQAGEGSDGAEREREEAPTKGRGKADAGLGDGFAGVLGSVPDSTVLILMERGGVAKNNSLLKVASRYGKVEEYITPKGATLERWIGNHGRELGIKLMPGAQAALGVSMPDLQALANELEKLRLYVGDGGMVDERVLGDISFASKQEDVFELTSAVARRDTKGALMQLQRLLDGGTAPEGILPVLAWQLRTLMQVRDMIDRKVPESYMAEKAGMSDFVVRKTVGQARQFTMQKLLLIHGRLLELDHAVKTGRAEADLSIDALVVEMCR